MITGFFWLCKERKYFFLILFILSVGLDLQCSMPTLWPYSFKSSPQHSITDTTSFVLMLCDIIQCPSSFLPLTCSLLFSPCSLRLSMFYLQMSFFFFLCVQALERGSLFVAAMSKQQQQQQLTGRQDDRTTGRQSNSPDLVLTMHM